MKCKKTISTIIVMLTFLQELAHASSPLSPEPEKANNIIAPMKLAVNEKDLDKVLSPMRKGQKAPFTGVLMSPAATANIIVELQTIDEKIRIEVNAAVQKQLVECDKKFDDNNSRFNADKKILQSKVDQKDRELLVFNNQLKKEKDSATNPYIWAGIGALGGIVTTVLITFAVSNVTK